MTEITELQHRLRLFRDARNWDQYHTPKNLAMALCGEAGELAALFQWLTPEEFPDWWRAREEIADVFIYLVQLAGRLGIDLISAANDKIEQNAAKYSAN